LLIPIPSIPSLSGQDATEEGGRKKASNEQMYAYFAE
jgi:hypothetical protein